MYEKYTYIFNHFSLPSPCFLKTDVILNPADYILLITIKNGLTVHTFNACKTQSELTAYLIILRLLCFHIQPVACSFSTKSIHCSSLSQKHSSSSMFCIKSNGVCTLRCVPFCSTSYIHLLTQDFTGLTKNYISVPRFLS